MESLSRFITEIDFNEIELKETVGKGAFGVVSKGVWRGDYVAVKMIETDSERRAFYVEVRQLSRVSHENIVKLYGACTKSQVCLVMEYAEGGSLYNVLHNAPKINYSGAHAMSWALQCARGVEYLHNMKPKALIHRDLKPPNLLLVKRGVHLKICDFGTACDYQTNMTNNKGSAAWMAPEVFEGNNYSEKCDVFSWGIILWEVLSRQKPFHARGTNAFHIMWAVHLGKRPALLKDCPKAIEDLITGCWAKEPEKRPAMMQIVKLMTVLSSFFKGADKPVIPLESCVCGTEDGCRGSCSCSQTSSSHDSSLGEMFDMRPPVTQVEPTTVNKDDHFYASSGEQAKLRVSNTAPASLASSRENLAPHEMSPRSNVRLYIDPNQKRRSTDLSSILEPKQEAKAHKRNNSYGNEMSVNAMIAKSAPAQPKQPFFLPSSRRSASVGATMTQPKPDRTSRSQHPYSHNIIPPAAPPPKRFNEFQHMDPQYQPFTPAINCPQSMAIYEEHRKMAHDYCKFDIEINLLNTRKLELLNELSEDKPKEVKAMQLNQDYVDLTNEKHSLAQVLQYLTLELESLKQKHNNIAGVPQQYPTLATPEVNSNCSEDGWVFVDKKQVF